jgi:restriction endonuclease S subunit
MNAPIILTSKEKISQEAVDDCFTNEISKAGTLIMSFKLSIGKVAILGTDAYHNEAIISIFPRCDEDNIFRDYLKVVLPIAANNGDIHGAIKGNTLNKKSLSDLMIPIPPFAEQLRIVNRMNELGNALDTIDDLQSSYITDSDVLKGKLIDAAICGKLTKQLPEDDTAEDLYKKIQEEKKQIFIERKGHADKKIKEIDADVPFTIPTQWKWIRFGDVGLFKKGPFGSALTKSMFVPKSDNTVKVYEQQHAIKKNCNLGTYYIKREYFDSDMSGFEVLPGDIIVSCAGTIGETYIMPDEIEQGIINQALMRVTLAAGIDKRFFQYYFDANLKKSAQDESNGSAIKNIPPFDVMKNWYFPLPPFAEQQRIVETLDNLLCNLAQ